MLTEILAEVRQMDPHAEHVRLNLVFCLFCKMDSDSMIEPGLWLLDLWQQLAGPALTWAMIGSSASSLSRVNKGTPTKIQREIRACSAKKISFFRLQGPQAYGPDFRLLWLVTQNAKEESSDQSNLVEMILPLPQDYEGWARSEQIFAQVSKRFSYDSGYVAPALVFSKETEMVEAGELIAPLACRHKGLDVPNNMITAFFIGRMTRGARWITYLSRANAARLDQAKIEGRPEQVQIVETARGLMIKSADQPEIGNANRQLDVPGLNYVAELLRPITFFGDKNLQLLFRKNLELVEAWENRFFDT